MDAEEEALRDKLIAETQATLERSVQPQSEQEMANNVAGFYRSLGHPVVGQSKGIKDGELTVELAYLSAPKRTDH